MKLSLAEFNERFIRKDIQYFERDVPQSIRKALRGALHASKIVSPEIKALVAAP